MMAAADLVAADEIRVFALEVERREHRAAEDFLPKPGA